MDPALGVSVPAKSEAATAIFGTRLPSSGNGDAFAAVEPLLDELRQAVTQIGPGGQGLVMKLATKNQPCR